MIVRKPLFVLHVVSVITAGAILLTIDGCKKDNEPTVQERITSILTSAEAWQNPEVTVDGVDYSDLYKDFSIKFTNSTYTTTKGTPVWEDNGTWVFLNEAATFIKMDDLREVEINSITNDFLELSFQWDENTFEPGRSNSVKGKQKFKLKKKK
jgi:hypothetical protein